MNLLDTRKNQTALVAACIATVAAFLPGPVSAQGLPEGCEAVPDTPVCSIACHQGTLMEMIVYGSGDRSMVFSCGGAGPLPSSGYVSAAMIACDSGGPGTETGEAQIDECSTVHVVAFEGTGRCELLDGDRAVCRPLDRQ